MSILVQPSGCHSNRALLFRPRAATSDCTKWWCGAIRPSNPPTGEIQDFPICSVNRIMGDPQTSREESLTLYVGPSRDARRLARASCSGVGRPPSCSSGGTSDARDTSRDGAERSPCLRWSPIVGGGDLPRRVSCRSAAAGLGLCCEPGVSLQTCSFILGEACVAVASQKSGGNPSRTRQSVQMCLFSSTPGVGRICTCE